MKILALDIATKCGWATATASGTWDFSLKRGESQGMKIVRFVAKVRELIKLENIGIVYYELPAGLFKSAIIHEAELIGAMKVLLEEQGVIYSHFSPSEIKKHATGKGNANKQAMIDAAEKHFQRKMVDDNEADALWIYSLAKQNHQN